MKLFKNFILIALCLSLFIAVLVSCGEEDIPAETTGESVAASSETAAQTTEKSVYTGNPIGGGEQTPAPPSGGETSETVNSGPSDEAGDNGFSGGGLELPGITP